MGWDFVQRALNEEGYVEELSGLKEVGYSSFSAVRVADSSKGSRDGRSNTSRHRVG